MDPTSEGTGLVRNEFECRSDASRRLVSVMGGNVGSHSTGRSTSNSSNHKPSCCTKRFSPLMLAVLHDSNVPALLKSWPVCPHPVRGCLERCGAYTFTGWPFESFQLSNDSSYRMYRSGSLARASATNCCRAFAVSRSFATRPVLCSFEFDSAPAESGLSVIERRRQVSRDTAISPKLFTVARDLSRACHNWVPLAKSAGRAARCTGAMAAS